MGEKDLSKNLEFVKRNRDSLLKEHRDKFLLVYDGELSASFDTYERAAAEGIRAYGPEAPFLVYQLLEKEPLNFIMEAAL